MPEVEGHFDAAEYDRQLEHGVEDFGPFLAFTVSVRTSAKLIGAALHA